MKEQRLPKSSLEHVLKALVPYTEANLKLAFKPNLFFNDLEKIARSKEVSLRRAYYRAKKAGFIEIDERGVPLLTPKGRTKAARFTAKHLGANARLMVIFDIPEDEAWKRQRLRRLLKNLEFGQIQKSVWASEYDYRELILKEVEQLKLSGCIQIYAADRIYS